MVEIQAAYSGYWTMQLTYDHFITLTVIIYLFLIMKLWNYETLIFLATEMALNFSELCSYSTAWNYSPISRVLTVGP